MPINTSFNHGPHQIKMLLPSSSDHISKEIINNRNFYEITMLKKIQSLCTKNSTIVDVGANIGNHSVYFGKIIGCDVISIEPNIDSYKILEENVKLNEIEGNVEIHKYAAGAEDGTGTIKNDSNNNLGMAKVIKNQFAEMHESVKIKPLDDIIGDRRVNLIKIDVEGFETDVLLGAQNIIKRDRPEIFAEAATEELFREIQSILSKHKYLAIGKFNATPTYHFSPEENLKRKIVVGIATIPGNEDILLDCLESLKDQVDVIEVFCNGFEISDEIKSSAKYANFTFIPNGDKYGDAAKFFGVANHPGCIYMSCDDDIIYPKNYTETLFKEINRDRNQLICVHGSNIHYPIIEYYSKESRSVIHFESGIDRKIQVSIAGTGTLAFDTNVFAPRVEWFGHRNMADIWISIHAKKNNIPIYAIDRPNKWLKQNQKQRDSIYSNSSQKTGLIMDTSTIQSSIVLATFPTIFSHKNNNQLIVSADIEDETGINEFVLALNRSKHDVILIAHDKTQNKLISTKSFHNLIGELHLNNREIESMIKSTGQHINKVTIFNDGASANIKAK